MNENVTDLTVSMIQLDDIEKQTKFLNCGGDINIPHGEMFTTPVLAGTDGVLNVKEIFLRDKYYKNLKLTFKNGRVVDYSCDNFENEKESRIYVFENLLNSTENVPIGELAIGTNTLAYRTALDFGLFSRLPILLAEKMGPHIAVGDPCFARGEDSPVYNIYGKKEMVARDNEITKQRKDNPDCYVNFHTDITIPFNEMGLFAGVDTKTGVEYKIIEKGRFVPEAANKLNENLG
jgi:leucyl aminopeptidase (aminopeptidase T)